MKRRLFLKGVAVGVALTGVMLSTRKIGSVSIDQHLLEHNPHNVTLVEDPLGKLLRVNRVRNENAHATRLLALADDLAAAKLTT